MITTVGNRSEELQETFGYIDPLTRRSERKCWGYEPVVRHAFKSLWPFHWEDLPTGGKTLAEARPHAFPLVVLLGWLVLSLLFSATSASAADGCTLTWQGSSVETFGGYVVYWGPNSHPVNYLNSLDVGLVTTATITNLVAGSTNYFAVKAYDINHVLYSAYSSEVSYSSSYRIIIQPSGANFQVSVPIEGPWTLQESFDLMNWFTYSTGIIPTQVLVPNSSTKAFFRFSY